MGLIPIEDLDLTFAMFVTCWILIFIFHKTNGAGITAAAYREKHQGLVVQKLITANPALDVVQGFLFSCFKMLALFILRDNFKAPKVKLLRERNQLESLLFWIKSEHKVGANPGLA